MNMVVYFGADHRGFELKEQLKKYFQERGYELSSGIGNFSPLCYYGVYEAGRD